MYLLIYLSALEIQKITLYVLITNFGENTGFSII